MINRIAIAAALGALAGELATNPLAVALVDVVEQPAIVAVFGLPVAVGLVFLILSWLILRPPVEVSVILTHDPHADSVSRMVVSVDGECRKRRV